MCTLKKERGKIEKKQKGKERLKKMKKKEGRNRKQYQLLKGNTEKCFEAEEVTELEGEEEEQKEEKGEEVKEQKKIEHEYNLKLVSQQKEIMRNQDILLHTQDKQLTEKSAKIKRLQEELKKRDEGMRSEGEGSVSIPESGGRLNLIPESLKKFLVKQESKGKPEPKTVREEDLAVSEIQPSVSQVETRNVFVPQVQDSAVVLVPHAPAKSTAKRSGLMKPVPKSLRIPGKFYCKNCSSKFCWKEMLTYHEKNECLKITQDYICDQCSRGFYSETAVAEHYYMVHLKTHLYHCPKCNEPFYHKSRKSHHKRLWFAQTKRMKINMKANLRYRLI